MSAALPLALIMPTVTALLLVRALWWDRTDPPAPLTLLAALALGGGVGLGAYTEAIALYVGAGSRATVIGLDASLLVGAMLLWRRGGVRWPAAPQRAPWHASDRALVALVTS